MNKKLCFLFLLVNLMNCKTTDKDKHESPKSIEEAEVLSSCQGSYLPKSIGKVDPKIADKIQNLAAMLPPPLQKALQTIQLEFKASQNLAKDCQIANIVSDDFTLSSCWLEIAPQKATDSAKAIIFIDQNSKENLDRDLLNIVAQIHFTFILEPEKNGALEGDTEEKLIQLNTKFNSENKSSYSPTFAYDLFAQVFTEYFCRASTRDELKASLPATTLAFEALIASLTPSSAQTAALIFPAKHTPKPDPEVNLLPSKLQIGVIDETIRKQATVTRSKPLPFKKILIGAPKLIRSKNPYVVDINSSIANRDSAGSLGQKNPINIVIHGSFSGRSSFTGERFHPDSELCKKIARHYGGETVAFRWTGEVSDEAREQASKALGEYLTDLNKAGYQINIVAHSHGANIAAKAINDSQIQIGEFASFGRPPRADYQTPYNQITSHTVVAGKFDFVALLGGLGWRRGNFHANDKKDANTKAFAFTTTHSGTRRRIIETLEKSHMIRSEQIKYTKPTFCMTLCHTMLGIAILSAGAGAIQQGEKND